MLLSCCVPPLEAPSQKTFPNRTTIWPKTNVSIILFPTSPSQQASQSASQPASHPATQQLLSYQSQGADLCIYTYMIHTVTHYNITYRMNLNGVINHQIMDCMHVVCDPTRTWTHTNKTQICYLDWLLQRWLRSIDSACGTVCGCIQQFWVYNMVNTLILIVFLMKSLFRMWFSLFRLRIVHI